VSNVPGGYWRQLNWLEEMGGRVQHAQGKVRHHGAGQEKILHHFVNVTTRSQLNKIWVWQMEGEMAHTQVRTGPAE
jgi:hypothetical protein